MTGHPTERRARREISPERMDAAELCAAGLHLFGSRWKSALARSLGLSYQHVHMMSTGAALIEPRTAIAVRCLRDHQTGNSAAD